MATKEASAALSSLDIPPRFKLEWPDFSRPVSKKRRRAFRAQMRPLSLSTQRTVWNAIREAFPGTSKDCIAEVRVIDRAFARIQQETPSDRWYDDARTLPDNEGGEWPPGGYKATRMRRALGERRLYPPQMLTTSGHSFDVWLQDFHLNHHVQSLLPDGYMGGVVAVYDLHPRERKKYRRAKREKREITGVFS